MADEEIPCASGALLSEDDKTKLRALNQEESKLTTQFREHVLGDTNAGGNTAALATAALTKYAVTMAAADLAGPPSMLNISIVPGTHGTDAVLINAAWIEYTRA